MLFDQNRTSSKLGYSQKTVHIEILSCRQSKSVQRALFGETDKSSDISSNCLHNKSVKEYLETVPKLSSHYCRSSGQKPRASIPFFQSGAADALTIL